MQIFKVKGQKRSNFEKLSIFYIIYYEGPNQNHRSCNKHFIQVYSSQNVNKIKETIDTLNWIFMALTGKLK